MLRVIVTPWVRDALRDDPVEAMAVEAAARVAEMDGTLRLFAKSARGPFTAIINCPGSGFDGYRGSSTAVTGAFLRALEASQAVES